MRSNGTARELEQRRRLAIRRLQDGRTQQDVADFLGVHPRTVGRGWAAHRDRGDAGLAAQPTPGRPRRLTADQEAEVLAWLGQRPTAFGFETDLWTAPRVARRIEQRFGVRFHPRYVNAGLADRHITPQKPAHRAKERNQPAIDRWTAEERPRLQKKRRTRAHTSS